MTCEIVLPPIVIHGNPAYRSEKQNPISRFIGCGTSSFTLWPTG